MKVAKGMCLPASYNLELYYEISGFRNMDAFVARTFCIASAMGVGLYVLLSQPNTQACNGATLPAFSTTMY